MSNIDLEVGKFYKNGLKKTVKIVKSTKNKAGRSLNFCDKNGNRYNPNGLHEGTEELPYSPRYKSDGGHSLDLIEEVSKPEESDTIYHIITIVSLMLIAVSLWINR